MAAVPDALWLWNGNPAPDLLRRQLAAAGDSGYRSLAVWPWAGLEVPLLSDEYLNCIRDACDAARSAGVTLWLADDLHWPSGTAAGQLLRDDPALAQRVLVCSTRWVASPTSQIVPWRGEGERLVLALALDDAGARRDLTVQLEEAGVPRRQWRASSWDGYRVRWESDVWDAQLRLPPGEWFLTIATAVRTQPLMPSAVGCAWCPQMPGTLDTANPAAVEAYRQRVLAPLVEAVGTHAGHTVAGIISVAPPSSECHDLTAADGWRQDVLPYVPDLSSAFEQLFQRQLGTHLPYALAPLHEQQPSPPLEQLNAYAEEQRRVLFDEGVTNWCIERSMQRLMLTPAGLAELPVLPLTLRGERKRAVEPARVLGVERRAVSSTALHQGAPRGVAAAAVASLVALRSPGPVSHERGWRALSVFTDEWEWQAHSANYLPLGEWEEWSHVSRARDGTVRFDLHLTFEADYVPSEVALLWEDGILQSAVLNGTQLPLDGAREPQPTDLEFAGPEHRLIRLLPGLVQPGANMVEATAALRPVDRIRLSGSATAGPLALLGAFSVTPATVISGGLGEPGGAPPHGRSRHWRLGRPQTTSRGGAWTAAGFPRFSGTATYAQTIHLPRLPAHAAARLTVEAFGGPAAVRIDGQEVERAPHTPFVFDLRDAIREGLNRIEITCGSGLGPRLVAGVPAGLESVRLEIRE